MKIRVIACFLCVLLLCGLCAVPASADADLHGTFMKTAFMVSRYKAFFAQGEAQLSFITQYLEHVCPEMRTYEVIREPYYNIVHLFYAVPVDEYETLVQRYFELDDRIRGELQAYYREKEDAYYIPCTVIDAVHDFSWYDYAGYKSLGGNTYEIYARHMDSHPVYTDVSGLTEGVDYVRVVEHRKRFHPTLQVTFLKAEVFNRPITDTVCITVHMNNGIPQIESAVLCDVSRFISDGAVPPPDRGIADRVVNTFLPDGVSCSGQNALPNGACLVVEALTQGETFDRISKALAGKGLNFTAYTVSALDDRGNVLQAEGALRMTFAGHGDGGCVYRLDEGSAFTLAGNAAAADIRTFGVYVVTDTALPTTAAPTTTMNTSPTTSGSAASSTSAIGSATATSTANHSGSDTAPTLPSTSATAPSQPVSQAEAPVAAIVGIAVGAAVLIVAAAVWLLLKKKQ